MIFWRPARLRITARLHCTLVIGSLWLLVWSCASAWPSAQGARRVHARREEHHGPVVDDRDRPHLENCGPSSMLAEEVHLTHALIEDSGETSRSHDVPEAQVWHRGPAYVGHAGEVGPINAGRAWPLTWQVGPSFSSRPSRMKPATCRRIAQTPAGRPPATAHYHIWWIGHVGCWSPLRTCVSMGSMCTSRTSIGELRSRSRRSSAASP